MNLTEFLPDIYLEAPGCPELVALNALRHTLRDFCERTHAWQETLDAIAPLEGFPSYDMDAPPDSEVAVILSATYAGRPVPVTTAREMDFHATDWRNVSGGSVSAIIPGVSSIRVYPVPVADDEDTIVIRAALRPTHSATTCGDVLDGWREGIAAGALARLKKIPNKPWSDREAVSVYARDFGNAIADALSMTLRGNTVKSLRVEPRSFG